MGVRELHQFVQRRGQQQDRVTNQRVNTYLREANRNSKISRVIIDGNNFAFSLLRESQVQFIIFNIHYSHVFPLKKISI